MLSEDEEALAGVAEGDRAALRRLYVRHAPALLDFAAQWTAHSADAGDVVQETFLAVWRSAAKFQGKSSVKTWIFSIARNKALDRNRLARRLEPLDPDFDAPDLGAPNPQALLESAENAARVRACVDGLQPALRRAVQLAFFQDFSYREIAAIEDTPEGTIKTRILRAKQLLMRCLGGLTPP